jgi:hypothetical protein
MSRNCQKLAKIQKAIELEMGFKQKAAEKGLIEEQKYSDVRLAYLRNQMIIHDETCRKNSCSKTKTAVRHP